MNWSILSGNLNGEGTAENRISSVVETTYTHLTDEGHVKAAEIATRLREEEDESPLSPDVCPTCGDNFAPDAKACPGRGDVVAPNAERTKEDSERSKQEADDLEEVGPSRSRIGCSRRIPN